MYRKHHTKGIVISSKIEGGDSKRINLFAEKFGLISARVQGARMLRSKLRNSSQDLSLGEFSLVHGKSSWRLVGARADKNYFEIFRNNSEKLKIAGNVLNLVRKLAGEEEGQPQLFSIVSNFLKFLEKAEEEKITLAECLVLLKILNNLGYMKHDPELSVPISSHEIEDKDLDIIAPRRAKVTALINESLGVV